MGREHRRSNSKLVFVGVLDLRARHRTVLQRELLLDRARDGLTAYCVLRLGDQHHRTPSFPPEGLEEVPARRTTVDDEHREQAQAFNKDSAAGVFWESPASWAAASKNEKLTSQPGFEWEWSDLQHQKRPQGERSVGPHLMEDGDDSCSCPAESLLLLEFYNDANVGRDSGEPIEGFEAEALGVLRVNLSEFLMPNFDEQPADHFDAPEDVPKRRSIVSCVGANRRNDGMGPDLGELRPHAQKCTQDGGAKSWQRTKERWVGGIVHPTCGSHQGRHGADSSSRGFVVEARLEMTWGVDGVTRSQRPVYDNFGQAVDPRNARKCRSAEGLWALQEPLRRARWKSEAGRAAWSALPRNGRYTDMPPVRHRQNLSAKNGGQDRKDVLRELVWTGVPADMREEVYMSLSGATSKYRLCGDGYYEKLSSDCHQLRNDHPRDHEQESCTLVLEKEEWSHSRRLDSGTAMCAESDSSADHPSASSLPKPHHSCNGCGRSYTPHSSRTRSCHRPHKDSFGQPTSCFLSSLSRKFAVEEIMEERTTAAMSPQPEFQHQISQDTLDVWQEIEADLDRVFINGIARVNTSAGTASMRRVLRAYSLRNPSVGYCQGMNFIAGLLLQVVSEEAAFWLLAAYCEDLHPDYHTKSMLRARSDIAALKDIVRRELPRFHARAGEVGMPLELKLTQWLVVGFINCFPAHVALRVLEISFIEGSDVFLATAVAFLRLHEAEILKGEDIADVVCTLDRAQSGMYETDILLAQVWRELAAVGTDIRAARAWHLNLMLRTREAEGNGRLQECKTLEEEGSERHRIGQDLEGGRGGWLRGRSSGEAGSAWLFLVPEALSGQVEAMLTTLNRKAFTTTHNLFVDGKLARTSLAPLIVGGVRWLMGWRTSQS